MTTSVDLYYTMRSPYCYLSTPILMDLVKKYDLQFQVKPVYPLAVSDPSFFDRVNPMWPPYLQKDTKRIAERLDIPFRWPRPDPIVQDMQTRKIAAEQPYIQQLTHYAQLASEQGLGLEYVSAVSGLLYNPDVDGWDKGNHLAETLSRIGLDKELLDNEIAQQCERLEDKIQRNRQDQLSCGHWGAPLFVFEQEIFFGQDRIEDLVWHLKMHGLTTK